MGEEADPERPLLCLTWTISIDEGLPSDKTPGGCLTRLTEVFTTRRDLRQDLGIAPGVWESRPSLKPDIAGTVSASCVDFPQAPLP